MSRLTRFFSHTAPPSKSTTHKRLRLETLERKDLLAGDVMASLVGGDLFLTGDVDDNTVQVTRDSSLSSPGVGEVSVIGRFGTTVNGDPSVNFSGANAVTGNIYFNFDAGGDNIAVVGESPFVTPDPLELPGDVQVVGGAGGEFLDVQNVFIHGDAILDDSAGGETGSVSLVDSRITGSVRSETIADYSDLRLLRATVDGDATLISEGVDLVQSVVLLTSSTVGDDVKFVSNAAQAETQIYGMNVGDNVILNTGDGDDSVVVGLDLAEVGNTIGGDFRIESGGGDDEVELSGFEIGDDLVFDGGAGDDVFFMEPIDVTNFIGDDFYATGGEGADEISVEDAAIGDELCISTGDGDDAVFVVSSTVGYSALISLGEGENESELEDVDFGRALTVLGGGTNTIDLIDITTSHFVTIITAGGDDSISMTGVTTTSALVATNAGADEVEITESEFDYLYVLLGSGDDTLTIDNVTVNRYAFLDGGRGEDTLVDVDDASDINFEIDFAFENYEA